MHTITREERRELRLIACLNDKEFLTVPELDEQRLAKSDRRIANVSVDVERRKGDRRAKSWWNFLS